MRGTFSLDLAAAGPDFHVPLSLLSNIFSIIIRTETM